MHNNIKYVCMVLSKIIAYKNVLYEKLRWQEEEPGPIGSWWEKWFW